MVRGWEAQGGIRATGPNDGRPSDSIMGREDKKESAEEVLEVESHLSLICHEQQIQEQEIMRTETRKQEADRTLMRSQTEQQAGGQEEKDPKAGSMIRSYAEQQDEGQEEKDPKADTMMRNHAKQQDRQKSTMAFVDC